MKTRRLKICSIVICVFCLFSICSTAYDVDESFSSSIECNNQDVAIELYTALINSFADASGNISYPDYYGGSYLDENGYLVVSVCDCTQNTRQLVMSAIFNGRTHFCSSLSSTERITFTTVLNSYNDILNANNRLIDFVTKEVISKNKYANLKSKLVEFYINENDNCLTVGLTELDEDAIEIIKSVVKNPKVLNFVIVERPTLTDNTNDFTPSDTNVNMSHNESQRSSTVVNPGDPLTIIGLSPSSSGYYSAGFRCYVPVGSSYLPGFVTAGHSIDSIGATVYSGHHDDQSLQNNPPILGTIRMKQYSGNIDAAVVVLNSGEMSNVTANNQHTIVGQYYTTSLPTNAVVYKDGATTLGQFGEVVSQSASLLLSNCFLTDLLKATYWSEVGDSGGIVYSYVNSNYTVVGINVAGGIGIDLRQYGYACQAKNIVPYFSIVPY